MTHMSVCHLKSLGRSELRNWEGILFPMAGPDCTHEQVAPIKVHPANLRWQPSTNVRKLLERAAAEGPGDVVGGVDRGWMRLVEHH